MEAYVDQTTEYVPIVPRPPTLTCPNRQKGVERAVMLGLTFLISMTSLGLEGVSCGMVEAFYAANSSTTVQTMAPQDIKNLDSTEQVVAVWCPLWSCLKVRQAASYKSCLLSG